MIELLISEKVEASDIHRPVQAVYGDETVDRRTVTTWEIKFLASVAGKENIKEKYRTG